MPEDPEMKIQFIQIRFPTRKADLLGLVTLIPCILDNPYMDVFQLDPMAAHLHIDHMHETRRIHQRVKMVSSALLANRKDTNPSISPERRNFQILLPPKFDTYKIRQEAQIIWL